MATALPRESPSALPSLVELALALLWELALPPGLPSESELLLPLLAASQSQ